MPQCNLDQNETYCWNCQTEDRRWFAFNLGEVTTFFIFSDVFNYVIEEKDFVSVALSNSMLVLLSDDLLVCFS